MPVNWTEQHQFERLNIAGRRLIKALLYGCELRFLSGAVLEKCCLTESKVVPQKMEDIVGVTVTLDCFSWKDVHLNELAFDLMLWLLSLTKGNDEKRALLKRVIRSDHMKTFEAELEAATAREKSIDERPPEPEVEPEVKPSELPASESGASDRGHGWRKNK